MTTEYEEKKEAELRRKIIDRIPDYQVFLTTEELDESGKKLAEKYPEAVSLLEIGRSKEDWPVYCLKIGNGSRNALLMGCPHPNEPIGAMMLEAFSQILAEDEEIRRELDYTFYIVKTVDPDGLRRNAGWLKGPFTYYNYARHFFRPASDQQVDWTYPIDYKKLHFHNPVPETQALMHLIEETKPAFVYSLHNSGFSGAYWYAISENGMDYLVDQLQHIPEKYGVYVKRGEPETPFCVEYGNAVYKYANMKDIYDYYEKMLPGEDLSGILNYGETTAYYANQNGRKADVMTAEIGYFKSEYLHDTSDSAYTRKEAALVKCQALEDYVTFAKSCHDTIAKYIPEDNQYMLALNGVDEGMLADVKAERSLAETSEEFKKTATKAQWFDYCIALPYMISLWYGMLASAAEDAIPYADETGKEQLQKIREQAEAELKKKTDELEAQIPCETFSIRDLAAYQLESGLLGLYAAKFSR